MNGSKLFLYLARRDRTGIRNVMVLQGLPVRATRVTDIAMLRLDTAVSGQLEAIVQQYRLEWDLWLEDADTYQELSERLRTRGYVNIPDKSRPLHPASSVNNPYPVDTRNLNQPRVMLQKP